MPAHPLQARRRRVHLTVAATLSAVAALAILLRRFSPDQSSLYPLCPIHQLTGLLCPGCGATRALAFLFHGDLPHAWHSNALLVLLLPILLLYAAGSYARALTARPAYSPNLLTLSALFTAVAAFTLLRNLP